MFELEKAYDTLRLVAEKTQKIAETDIQKAEAQLHAVKRLVRPADGKKPYYRTYWVSDWQQASEAQRSHQDFKHTAKKVLDTKKDLERKPDDQWYNDRHNEAMKEHGKVVSRLDTLDKTALKTEDRTFKTKIGEAPFASKEAELENVKTQIAENQASWEAWSKEGPEKVREEAQAAYKKAWSDAGLELEGYYDFDGKVKSSDGKTDLISVQHRADYNFRGGDAATYEPKLEVRLKHSSFDTKDPEDFKYLAELSNALAKVNTVTSNPKLMKEMNDLCMKARMADKSDTKNDFSAKGQELNKRKTELEKQIVADKIDEVISELGGDSFELEQDFHFETGRKHAPRYRYAKVVKSTPKQVEVGFSDSPGNDKSFYNTKRMSQEDFRKFMQTHVDLDAHLPNYDSKDQYHKDNFVANLTSGNAVKKEEKSNTGGAGLVLSTGGVNQLKLSELINEKFPSSVNFMPTSLDKDKDHVTFFAVGKKSWTKEQKESIGAILDDNNIDFKWSDNSVQIKNKFAGAKEKAKPKQAAAKPAPAPERHTMDPENNKKVNGYDNYSDPKHGTYNKGDQVIFEHKGEMKGGKVVRVNVYQRFANPYVVMEGSDGKKYELVISKVNVHKD